MGPAKSRRMLYDFHQTQNARKPGSVHATYLLHGTARAMPAPPEESQQDGQDAYMQSSPFVSSSAPQEESIQEIPPVKLVTLAREEHLEGIAHLLEQHTGSSLRQKQAPKQNTMRFILFISTA